MIGQLLIGRYLILKELGVGGFSETHLAIDKYLLDQPVCVVKQLKLPSRSTLSLEKARQLFEGEARILERLGRHHAQIPTLFAYCHEQDQTYQIEEYIEGENLQNWLTPGRCLSPEGAVELLSQILPILEYVHSQNVIHRDIKPSNLIQRRQDGRIVLIDFGAACDLSERRWKWQSYENKAITIGTPGYMPMEQQQGRSRFNSDLYALGVTVIQLLTGVHPQELQIDPSSGELNWQGYLQRGAIDPQLVEILERMVRQDYRLRYQSAAEVLVALKSLSLAKRRLPQRSLTHRKRRNMAPKNRVQKILKPAWAVLFAAALGGGYYCFRNTGARAFLSQIDFAEIGITDSRADALRLALHDLMARTDEPLTTPNDDETATKPHSLLWQQPFPIGPWILFRQPLGH